MSRLVGNLTRPHIVVVLGSCGCTCNIEIFIHPVLSAILHDLTLWLSLVLVSVPVI